MYKNITSTHGFRGTGTDAMWERSCVYTEQNVCSLYCDKNGVRGRG